MNGKAVVRPRLYSEFLTAICYPYRENVVSFCGYSKSPNALRLLLAEWASAMLAIADEFDQSSSTSVTLI